MTADDGLQQSSVGVRAEISPDAYACQAVLNVSSTLKAFRHADSSDGNDETSARCGPRFINWHVRNYPPNSTSQPVGTQRGEAAPAGKAGVKH